MDWLFDDIADFMPRPENSFAILIMITVVISFFLLSGCAHQPPGADLYLMVR